jgi:hypothetical protein
VETAGASDVVETPDEEVERLASLIRRTELFGMD